uniref:Uncharacterized protein n=1 Tax=Romanomermis culicivorax TaxID=13658 RepID=A0A915J688_ROMCU
MPKNFVKYVPIILQLLEEKKPNDQIAKFFVAKVGSLFIKSFHLYHQNQRRHSILIFLRSLLYVDAHYHWPRKHLLADKDRSGIINQVSLCQPMNNEISDRE